MGKWYLSVIVLAGLVFNLRAQSRDKIDSLKLQLEAASDEGARLKLYHGLNQAWAESNFDSALWYGQLLYKKALIANDTLNIIYGLRGIAYAHDYAYHIDSARQYYLAGLNLSILSKDTLQIADSYFSLGTLKLLDGDYVAALLYYEDAIAVYNNHSRGAIGLSKVYNNLGIIYRRTRQYEKAIDVYQRALKLSGGNQENEQTANLFINLANAFSSFNQYDSAKKYFKKVYDFSLDTDDNLFQYYASNGLGIIYFDNKDYNQARNYFTPAANDSKLTDLNLKITAYGYLGAIESLIGNYTAANQYFTKGQQFVSEKELVDQTMGFYLQLAEHHERQGDYRQSLFYQKAYARLNAQVLTNEVIDRTTEWEQRYQNQEKAREIAELKLANQQAELFAIEKSKERNAFIFSSAVLFIFLISIIIFYRSWKRTATILKEKNTLIQTSLTEKELLMKEVHHRVKNNLQMITSLLNLQSHNITERTASETVLESKNRVHAMSLIHHNLYSQDSVTEINIRQYLLNLLDNLESSYQTDDKDIEVKFKAIDVVMDVDVAIPMGLIVNELVSNCFKHAFNDLSKGIITVRFQKNNDKYLLSVCDNGRGNGGIDLMREGSLGMVLIRDLSKKLKAELRIETTNGVSTELIFLVKAPVL